MVLWIDILSKITIFPMVLILIYLCKYSSLNNIYQCRKTRFQRRWCMIPYIYYEANHINIFNLKKNLLIRSNRSVLCNLFIYLCDQKNTTACPLLPLTIYSNSACSVTGIYNGAHRVAKVTSVTRQPRFGFWNMHISQAPPTYP